MGELVHLPPRYRIAYKSDETEGYVVDEATGKDWDTRRINEAIGMMEQLREHFTAVMFWVTSGG